MTTAGGAKPATADGHKPAVLIVGGGPTGLTAAVELARRGIIPRVIEKRKEASNLSRAVGIAVKSMDILKPSGVADAIEAEAILFGGLIMRQGERKVVEVPLNFDDKSRLYGLAQDRTEAHLTEAFERYGGRVEYGCSFEGLEQDESGVTATINGNAERFDYVVGADGVKSAVRGALGLEFPGFDLPDEWSIADVYADEWDDPTFFHGFLLPEGHVCIVVPMENSRFRVIADAPDALAVLPIPMKVRNIRRSGTFTISIRQVEQYNVGRVCLAGDAAHCHSPAGGRGMNLGIADAADLAERIAAGDVSGYHDARHPEGAHVLEFSERARKVMANKNWFVRQLVITVFTVVGAIPPLQKAIMRFFVNG